MKFLTLSSILLILLVACAGETNTERVIDNQSSHDLKILIYFNGVVRGDTLAIAAGTRQVVGISTLDRASDESPDCIEFIDSAYTTASDSGRVVKHMGRIMNWEAEVGERSGFPADYKHTCTFIVRDADIEF